MKKDLVKLANKKIKWFPYLLIASMGYFYLSNRYTLSAFLGEKITTKEKLAHWGSFIDDVVLRTVSLVHQQSKK